MITYLCSPQVQRQSVVNTAAGKRVRYVPGWDCHGLPIEIKALEAQRLSSTSPNLDAVSIRKAARSLASKTVKDQKKGFKEWGIMADWDAAWTTMDKTFELKQLGVFQEMVRSGLIFRRYKPVYWSPSSRTALAEAELEYKDDHESTAAFVKFPLPVMPLFLRMRDEELGLKDEVVHAVIWTTTPWTLPANRAIAVGEDLEYAVVKVRDDLLLIAKSRIQYVLEQCGITEQPTVIANFLGKEIVGEQYTNELRGHTGSPQPIISADFVSADSGTGLVHLAPGHGMDDYDVCTKHGIHAFAPVDDAGCFTADALPTQPDLLRGISVISGGSSMVLDILYDKVLGRHTYKHKYPYDWRTKLPVIVRATEQWFADVGTIKSYVLNSLEDVKFIPQSGKSRLSSFIKGRSEWCISRQRAWGVPIPALYDLEGTAVLTDASVAHIISTIEKRGIDAWWTDEIHDPAWVVPGLEGTFTRGRDTMDVWFDSGSSWTQTPGQADAYVEGTDQHRGWFQSSILTHAAASGRDVAPYKTLITHGFTLDQEGRKMSKSIGNTIAPGEIMNGSLLPPIKKKGTAGTSFDGLGADSLRLWVASSDYTKDVVIGQPVLKATTNALLKYRTTMKMLLGSMHQSSIDAPSAFTRLDMIAVIQLQAVQEQVIEAWQNYEFHRAIAAINRWVNIDLSSFYLEAIKDRVYCGDGSSAIPVLFRGFCQMLAPVTPILVEEAWSHAPEWYKSSTDMVHPLHDTMTLESKIHVDSALYAEIREDLPWLLSASAAIKTAQEEARSQKLIGSSLQSSVVLLLPSPAVDMFDAWKDELATIFVVSDVQINAAVDDDAEWQFMAEFEVTAGGGKGLAVVLPPRQSKCPRCWRYVAPEEDELCGRCSHVVS